MGWMDQRSNQKEVLDEHDLTMERILPSLRFMRWVNRWLGGVGAVLGFFERSAAHDGELTILDLGTGTGDIPVALQKWAKLNKRKFHITAIDSNPDFIEFAKRRNPHPKIRYLCHSAFDLEKLGQFDYMMASMFFHHLPDEKIVELLQKMFQNSSRGFLVNDLYRHPVAYAGVACLTALRFDRVLFHDAKLSVKRGFREADALNYREWSGIDQLQIEQRPGFRITMSCRHG